MDYIGISANGTKVFSDPGAHPHRPELAKEAISKMVIPEFPADPTDRNQTRVAATVDLGRPIGVNHRTELVDGMRTFYMVRDDRDYPSLMTIDGFPTLESKLTNVCFWDSEKSHWVYYTNHEGVEDPWPEPGTKRFEHLSPEDQKNATTWHATHPLICTPAQIEQAKKEGLIKKEWYFSIWKEGIPFSPVQQPWPEYEYPVGPFKTEKAAKKEYEKRCENLKEREHASYPGCRFEKTWHDEAELKLFEAKFYMKIKHNIIERFEKNGEAPIVAKHAMDTLPALKKEIEELELIVK